MGAVRGPLCELSRATLDAREEENRREYGNEDGERDSNDVAYTHLLLVLMGVGGGITVRRHPVYALTEEANAVLYKYFPRMIALVQQYSSDRYLYHTPARCT